MHARDFLLWGLLAGLWGSSFLAIGVAVEGYSPQMLVFGRMAIGALILAAVLLIRGGSFSLGARGWTIAAVVGFSGNVLPFLLISYAEQEVDTGLAALIMGIAPIVTLAAAPFAHSEESLGSSKILGAIAGFGGVALLVLPDVTTGHLGGLVPQIALIVAALCYSFTALFSRRFPHSDSIQMAAASVLAGTVGLAGYFLVSFEPQAFPEMLSASSLAVLYLGLGPTALAALIYFYLIPRIGAAKLSQVNYVVPVVGTLLGIAFLGEQPVWTTWLALPLILAGVYLVTRKGPVLTKKPAPADHPAE